MTITSTPSEIAYAGDGITTVFTIPFKFDTAADLKVVETVASVPAVVTTGFSIAGGGGGTGTLTRTPALPVGTTLLILDNPELTQPVDYIDNDAFPAATHEGALDRVTRIAKRLYELVQRSVRVTDGDLIDGDNNLLPLSTVRAGKFFTFDAQGRPSVSTGTGNDSALRTDLAAGLSALVHSNAISYARTAAEIAASVVPLSIFRSPYPVYDLSRILTPNSTAARAANSAILKALCNPAVAGPRGTFVFTNTTGADTYYFGAVAIPVADGISFDGCGCTADVAGSFTSANDTLGWLTFIRDVAVENLKININYDGTGGTANLPAMRIGGRTGYDFNGVFAGTGEDTFASLMGNIVLRNIRITTNNAAANYAILMLGGLQNVLVENVHINGSSTVPWGIYYEFGFYHYEATVANRRSSHALNMRFSNVSAKSLKTTVQGAVIELRGANPSIIENVYGDGCYNAVNVTIGEAMFFAVGAPFVLDGNSKTRGHTLTNITAQNVSSGVAMVLDGCQTAAGGYLSGSGLTDSQLCDLQAFKIDNPTLSGSILVTGSFRLNGGAVRNGSTSGGVIIGQDVLEFDINGTHILDAAGEGIRADIANSVRGVTRLKRGTIRNAKVAGSAASAGIGLDLCDGVRVIDCQLGYSSTIDAANEATQTFGVTVGTNGANVVLDNNYCKPASGNAYNKSSGPAGCTIISMRGTQTVQGDWHYGGPRTVQTVTYSASMTPDLALGPEIIITATNGTAFTINAPTNPMRCIVNVTIRNASGGALGAVTFSGFKGTSGWTQPANGNSRSVQFRYNGVNATADFVEVGRTEHDVAN